MSRATVVPAVAVISLVWLVVSSSAVHAQETGDVDGDGRLSIGDIAWLLEGREPAPGSLVAFEGFTCLEDWSAPIRLRTIAASIYLESLRRGVSGSYAHWDPFWSRGSSQEPAPADDRVSVSLGTATAPGGLDDRVRLTVNLQVLTPVRSFSLVLEGDQGIVRLASFDSFSDQDWRRLSHVSGELDTRHTLGDLDVGVSPATFLITGGRYVLAYNLNLVPENSVLAPGSYTIVAEARLRRGTRADRYALRGLAASEVLLADGTVVVPVFEDEGAIVVEEEVVTGWDEGPPPLEFDSDAREVLGKIEFRVVSDAGEPITPVAEGLPGDDVQVRVQMRTEVPLNHFYYQLNWPIGKFCCVPQEFLFSNPEDEKAYLPYYLSWRCEDALVLAGSFRAGFRLAGSAVNSRGVDPFAGRPLEYFKPLNEWTDISLLTLHIPPTAEGGTEVPLVFGSADPAFPHPGFTPYTPHPPCRAERWPDEVYWHYDVETHDNAVRILGDDPPGDAPDLGVRFELGEGVEGVPGDVVDVPLYASSPGPVRILRVAFELDSELAAIEEVEALFLVERTEDVERSLVARGDHDSAVECVDTDGDGLLDRCFGSLPSSFSFLDTDGGFVVLDIWASAPRWDDAPPYPGSSRTEIARLKLRILDAPPGARIAIRPVEVPFATDVGVTALLESGGYGREALAPEFPTCVQFAPAAEVRGTTVAVTDWFARGDVNSDGAVDPSDPVAALLHLFATGGELSCPDAADADDNGELDLSDPISLLGWLFLGTEPPSPPFPGCGSDPTPDELDCGAGCTGPRG